MKLAGISVLPEVQPGRAPLWRQTLRGFSRCAFQANELSALFFSNAAALFNRRMGAACVASVDIASVVARLLRANPELLGLDSVTTRPASCVVAALLAQARRENQHHAAV